MSGMPNSNFKNVNLFKSLYISAKQALAFMFNKKSTKFRLISFYLFCAGLHFLLFRALK
jgi:hypothetical protein